MKKAKSLILAAVHETATDLHQAGLLDQVTMREFDQMCLPQDLFELAAEDPELAPPGSSDLGEISSEPGVSAGDRMA